MESTVKSIDAFAKSFSIIPTPTGVRMKTFLKKFAKQVPAFLARPELEVSANGALCFRDGLAEFCFLPKAFGLRAASLLPDGKALIDLERWIGLVDGKKSKAVYTYQYEVCRKGVLIQQDVGVDGQTVWTDGCLLVAGPCPDSMSPHGFYRQQIQEFRLVLANCPADRFQPVQVRLRPGLPGWSGLVEVAGLLVQQRYLRFFYANSAEPVSFGLSRLSGGAPIFVVFSGEIPVGLLMPWDEELERYPETMPFKPAALKKHSPFRSLCAAFGVDEVRL